MLLVSGLFSSYFYIITERFSLKKSLWGPYMIKLKEKMFPDIEKSTGLIFFGVCEIG